MKKFCFRVLEILHYEFKKNPWNLDQVVENFVLLKCRKLRREDQETSDWIVSRISLFYDMCCYLQSSKISSKSFLQGIL